MLLKKKKTQHLGYMMIFLKIKYIFNILLEIEVVVCRVVFALREQLFPVNNRCRAE